MVTSPVREALAFLQVCAALAELQVLPAWQKHHVCMMSLQLMPWLCGPAAGYLQTHLKGARV